jgi:hypothetical protein
MATRQSKGGTETEGNLDKPQLAMDIMAAPH